MQSSALPSVQLPCVAASAMACFQQSKDFYDPVRLTDHARLSFTVLASDQQLVCKCIPTPFPSFVYYQVQRIQIILCVSSFIVFRIDTIDVCKKRRNNCLDIKTFCLCELQKQQSRFWGENEHARCINDSLFLLHLKCFCFFYEFHQIMKMIDNFSPTRDMGYDMYEKLYSSPMGPVFISVALRMCDGKCFAFAPPAI